MTDTQAIAYYLNSRSIPSIPEEQALYLRGKELHRPFEGLDLDPEVIALASHGIEFPEK